MQNALIHRQQFKIRGYDVGISMQTDILSMIRILHDSAVDQVIDLGFSALQLAPRSLAWVLVQQYLEILDNPRLGDLVEVVTYPSGTDKVFTYRDYYMFSQEGALLAQASTTWILMNTAQRRISHFPDDISAILDKTNELEHLDRSPDIKNLTLDQEMQKIYEANYFELDFNGHISNHYFFKWILSAIPTVFLLNHQLKTLNVKLKGECFAEDQIISRYYFVSPLEIHHLLIRDEKPIASGISIWKTIR
ncbi:MAG: hypothetical protein KDC53_18505 [Saprospiraceae bacterium]|nr:hypothetical protein [Saprospiraceae bacterium]